MYIYIIFFFYVVSMYIYIYINIYMVLVVLGRLLLQRLRQPMLCWAAAVAPVKPAYLLYLPSRASSCSQPSCTVSWRPFFSASSPV